MGVFDRATCPVEADSRAFTDATLAALRADGWTPAGWARFSSAIAVRSAKQVVAHPRAAVEVTLLHGLFLAAGRRRGRCWVTTSWLMSNHAQRLAGPTTIDRMAQRNQPGPRQPGRHRGAAGKMDRRRRGRIG